MQKEVQPMPQAKYDKGRTFVRSLIKKKNPVNPYALGQDKLLRELELNPKAIAGLMEASGGNIFNLVGQDPINLLALERVGEGTLAKLIALFAMCHHYDQWASGNHKPVTTMEKREHFPVNAK